MTVGLMLSANESYPDQIKEARKNASVAETSNAILSGKNIDTQPDRLAMFAVPYTVEIAPCTSTNMIFETREPDVIASMVKILGVTEYRDSKITVRTASSRKIVLVLFSKGRPISWLVITRDYDAVTVLREHLFPDGKWVITGGKVVNDIEKWMRQRSLDW